MIFTFPVSFVFFLSSSHIEVFFLPSNVDLGETRNLAIFSVDEKHYSCMSEIRNNALKRHTMHDHLINNSKA